MNKSLGIFVGVTVVLLCSTNTASAAYHFSDFQGRPPIHIFKTNVVPQGLSPERVKMVYHLPKSGGHGTIAIVDAYDAATIENDLRVFSRTFELSDCTTKNGCFEKHAMSKSVKSDSGWALETALDVEWAHAIAPDAKILLVEVTTPSGDNLVKAVDYAVKRADVVAVSMSWGGGEFPEEKTLDSHFVSKTGAAFFASSGDNGAGASWPAASPTVVAVGGTLLSFKTDGTLSRESAWNGSGGGVSAYEEAPAYQKEYSIPKSKGMRAIPDVSYNADPQSGVSVYKNGKWFVLGGTSAGAPQWAAIHALGHSAFNEKLYTDKAGASHAAFFRDITSGSNGDCAYYCDARKHYDYITGLGSPLGVHF